MVINHHANLTNTPIDGLFHGKSIYTWMITRGTPMDWKPSHDKHGVSTVVNQTRPFGWGHCTRIMYLQKASKIEMLTNKQLEMISTHRHKWISGWWFQPLWKIWKSVGMIIPNIWKVLKIMFQTTNQICWSCPRMIRTTDYVYTGCWVKSCHPPPGYSGKKNRGLSATSIGQRPHAPKKKRDHVSSITLEYGYV